MPIDVVRWALWTVVLICMAVGIRFNVTQIRDGRRATKLSHRHTEWFLYPDKAEAAYIDRQVLRLKQGLEVEEREDRETLFKQSQGYFRSSLAAGKKASRCWLAASAVSALNALISVTQLVA